MKKLYGKRIGLDIYNWEVPIFYGDAEALKQWAIGAKIKGIKEEMENMPKTMAGFCYREDPEKSIVPKFIYIGKTKNNYNIISHEALHYAMFLLANLNVEIDPTYTRGHEALTYLTGYIVGEITNGKWKEYDFKNKKWKTKKKK